MEFNGHIQGAAARKHTGFSYRVPILSDVTMRQLDPERLNYADEYPRSVNPPSGPALQTKDVADFAVTIGAAGQDNMSAVQVWLRPNEYTAAKAKLLVCEFQATNALTLRHEYCDEALRRAFGET